MPVVSTPDIRQRALALLRANPGREYTMAELGSALRCGLTMLPAYCRELAVEHKDVWFVEPPAPGVAARVYSAKVRKP